MGFVDYAVIVVYFGVVIALGFWYQRRAARDLDAYFLGNKRLHWLALSMSGSVSNFDITGTMWIVTLLYLFGMKSMWNHWMWGFLMGAFFLAYMGKWVRRSGVMTGAEWMLTRFGGGRDGQTARVAYALMAVVTLASFVGYAFQGIGKFAGEYVNFGLEPQANARLCASLIFAATTLYVLLGGLFSVVITDVIQTIILTCASIVIAVAAYSALTPELLAAKLPTGFTSLVPKWHVQVTDEMSRAGYAGYEFFGVLVIVWVIKGLLLNAGGPGQMYDFQRFLAARNPRDAAKVGAAWSGFLIVRWAMTMGIALLALTGLVKVAESKGPAAATAPTTVAATAPATVPAKAADNDTGFDAERVMPVVLRDCLRPGLRGLVIAGLLAAFMSTFSSTVNAGASYLVRDLYQPLVRHRAGQRHLIWASYVATVAIVVIGLVIGFQTKSIGKIFNWIMVALGGAFVIPNVLRWYWWRLNGWGYALGTLAGMAAALIVPWVPGLEPMQVSFPLICCVSLLGTLAGAFLIRPTDPAVLVDFYRKVRPFGVWGPVRVKAGLSARELQRSGEGLGLAVVNVLLGCAAILGIYLFPMYLVGHWHVRAMIWLGVAVVAGGAMYFTWYRRLPPPGEDLAQGSPLDPPAPELSTAARPAPG